MGTGSSSDKKQCLKEEFPIIVETLIGTQMPVSVTNGTTILAVKQALASKINAPEKQRLVFNGMC